MNQQAALTVIAVLSAAGAIVLALAGANVDDELAAAALSQWSNYLLIVAAVAVVGGIVLSGVRALLRPSDPADEQD